MGNNTDEHVLVALDAALTSVLKDLDQEGHALLVQGADPVKGKASLDQLFDDAKATLDKLAVGKSLAEYKAIVEANTRAHPWLRSLGVQRPEQSVNAKALDDVPRNPLQVIASAITKSRDTSWV